MESHLLKLLSSLENHPFLYLLAALSLIWAIYNWRVFHDDDRPQSRERRFDWLREDKWGQLYLGFLAVTLDKITAWIGDWANFHAAANTSADSKPFPGRWLRCQPWSEPSFRLCLNLAFFYPIVSFLVFWAWSGSSRLGQLNLLPGSEDVQGWLRWAVVVGFGLLFSVIFYVLKLKARKKWLGTLLLYLVLSSVLSATEVPGAFLVFPALGLIVGVPTYVGGWCLGLLVYGSPRAAHQSIVVFAVAGAGIILL